MSPLVHRRSPRRRGSSDRSDSPVRGRVSPRKRSPSRRERSPARHRSSPRTRSPVRTNSSRRARSPAREKEGPSSRGRSPKHARSNSTVSRSPSPRTKHIRRAQAERDVDKVSDRERGRNNSREGDTERHREKVVGREVPSDISERRSARDKNGGGSSRSRNERSVSPMDRGYRNRHSSHSPSRGSRTRVYDEASTDIHSVVTDPSGVEQHWGDDKDSVTKMKAAEDALEAKQKQKPSFELSGKLAAETNRVKGVTLLFTEPSDARKPDIRWRLYVFKGGEVLNEPLYIHRQSCYLFGRERRVADIPTDHPSCSKQHAVIQFRQVEKEKPDGMLSKQVRPYVMDLGSTNGTFINDNRIEPQRYYELFEKDTIKFGNSSREYVILHEHSAT